MTNISTLNHKSHFLFVPPLTFSGAAATSPLVVTSAAATSSLAAFFGFCLSFRPNERLLSENSLFTLSFFGFFAEDWSPDSVPASETLLSFKLSLAVLSADSVTAAAVSVSLFFSDGSVVDEVVASAEGSVAFSSGFVVSFSVDLSFSLSVASAAGLTASVA